MQQNPLMTADEFSALLHRLTAAAEAGDGESFAACFSPDAVYHDYIYGAHAGRRDIARMLTGLFHRDGHGYRWEMFDPTGMTDPNDLVRIAVGRDAGDVAFATLFGPVRTRLIRPEVEQVRARRARARA